MALPPIWAVTAPCCSSENWSYSSLFVLYAFLALHLGTCCASIPFPFKANPQCYLLPETFPDVPITFDCIIPQVPMELCINSKFISYYLSLKLFGAFIISLTIYQTWHRKDRSSLCPRGVNLFQSHITLSPAMLVSLSLIVSSATTKCSHYARWLNLWRNFQVTGKLVLLTEPSLWNKE